MYLELLFKACSMNSSDVSICKMQYIQEDDFIFEESKVEDYCVINQGYDKIIKTYRSVCGHLYKSQILEGMGFPEGVRYAEDMIFNYELLNRKETIKATLVEAPLYYYFQNESSTTHDKNENDRILTVSCCIDKLYQYRSRYSYLFFDLALKITFSYRYHLYVFGGIAQNKILYKKMKKMCFKSMKGWSSIKWDRRIIYFIFLNVPYLYRKFMVHKDPSLIKWEYKVKKDYSQNLKK